MAIAYSQKNNMNKCFICNEGEGEYSQNLTTNGITNTHLICSICLAMFQVGSSKLRDKLEEYYNRGGTFEDLPVETKEKVEGL